MADREIRKVPNSEKLLGNINKNLETQIQLLKELKTAVNKTPEKIVQETSKTAYDKKIKDVVDQFKSAITNLQNDSTKKEGYDKNTFDRLPKDFAKELTRIMKMGEQYTQAHNLNVDASQLDWVRGAIDDLVSKTRKELKDAVSAGLNVPNNFMSRMFLSFTNDSGKKESVGHYMNSGSPRNEHMTNSKYSEGMLYDSTADQILARAKEEVAKALKEQSVALKEQATVIKTASDGINNNSNQMIQSLAESSNALSKTAGQINDSLYKNTRRIGWLFRSFFGKVRSTNVVGALANLEKTANDLADSLKGKGKTTTNKVGDANAELSNAIQKQPDGETPVKRGGSFARQERRNAELGKQKGFLALLIPALAKLLNKTPVWDMVKLLLLKLGKNHPLMAGTALALGPATIATLIGNAFMGNPVGNALKNVFGKSGSQLGKSFLTTAYKGFSKFTSSVVDTAIKAPKATIDAGKRATRRVKALKKVLPNKYSGYLAENYGDLLAKNSTKINLAKGNFEFENYLKNSKGMFSHSENMWKASRANYLKTIGSETPKILKSVLPTIAKTEITKAFANSSVVKQFGELGNALKTFSKTPIKDKIGLITQHAKGLGGGIKTGIRGVGVGLREGAKAVLNPFRAVEGLAKTPVGTTFAKGLKNVGGLRGAVKGVPGLGALLEVAFDIPDIIKAGKSGKKGALGKQLSKTGGGAIGSIVGGIMGSLLGPVGTAVGSMIGAWVGRIIGGGFGKHMGAIGENIKSIGSSIGNIFKKLTPMFKFFGTVLGGLLKPIRVVLGAIGWLLGGLFKLSTMLWKWIFSKIEPIATKVGEIFQTLLNGIDQFFADLRDESKHPFIAKVMKLADQLSGDDEKKAEESGVVGNGGKSATESAKSNTSTPSLNQSDLRYYGGVATTHMGNLGLKGTIDGNNSLPYVPMQNVGKVKALDDYLASRGYEFTYTSAMGGKHANGSGHYKGNKLDLQIKKKGAKYGNVLTDQDIKWLTDNGYIGGGAVGWEANSDQIGGGHYDLRVGNQSQVLTGTQVANAPKRQSTPQALTTDGIREGLDRLTSANHQQRESRTRNLIFMATDVTGSLGCWGITQMNNTGKKGASV